MLHGGSLLIHGGFAVRELDATALFVRELDTRAGFSTENRSDVEFAEQGRCRVEFADKKISVRQDMDVTNPQENPGLQLAVEISGELRRRYPAEVMAIGAHGALAHGDEREGTDVNLIVITYRPDTGPPPSSKRIRGLLVNLLAVEAQTYLDRARNLTVEWPLIADQFLHTLPLHDEVSWHSRLRDIHLAKLAEAGGREFTALALRSWCTAMSYYRRAQRHSDRYDSDGALLTLAQTRIATAVTEGLLTRTFYRSASDATRRTALLGADMQSVEARLAAHAEELGKRGRPVDGGVADLF